jgi:nitroreductase
MDALEALNTRNTAKTYGESAPTKEHLDIVLKAAVRAPDHGRLRPWRFMLIEGDERLRFGDILATSALRRVPGLGAGDLERERGKALRAPLIIVVACRIVSGTKVPAIEQLMAAGAAAQNILLALHSLGYAAAWKTGEAAYDNEVKKALGLPAEDHIVGFVYTGGGAGASFVPGKPASVEDAMLEFPRA